MEKLLSKKREKLKIVSGFNVGIGKSSIFYLFFFFVLWSLRRVKSFDD